MFLVPGVFIAVLTFPGVIVHEMGHQFFCRLLRVAVLDVCYFRFGSPVGYVVHEASATPAQQILVAIGPFIANSVIGALVALPSSIQVFQFECGSPLDYVLIWLGVSITMHAFPSTGDAKTLRSAVAGKGVSPLVKLIAYPIVGLILVGAIGSVVWLDAIYGVGVMLAIPKLLVAVLA
jgi:hypothetical protein